MRRTLPALGLALALAAPATAGKLEYNRDVRPILMDNCFACHGPDSAARKADLRLDRRDMAMESEAIVPGHPEKSALVERIYSAEKSEVMPPHKTNKTLNTCISVILTSLRSEAQR